MSVRRIAVLVPALSALPVTGAAAADTPDVAMLIDGTSGQTLAVRSREADFDRLWELLDPTYAGTVRVPGGVGCGALSGGPVHRRVGPRSAYDRWEREGGFTGVAPSTPGSGSGGGWLVPGGVGVVLGAGGMLLVRRVAGRRGGGPPWDGPRQELIEL
ncbi:hypothetical protein [Streptomyces acidiscabies]|uniref:Gram-positive cocci surface proteins LPxTG domain-containing protein n=1 Tax=Streptomyces acidiscabies TaxID=42234 RepID=A0A0L0K2A6_9ACTN|nr:hypothetical protein [Streptomyces acidiscabies]KND31909.1 hypothetical protein IQ63_25215 [Streptomyces acidiscabies]